MMPMHKHTPCFSPTRPAPRPAAQNARAARSQRGVVLVIALIVLVAMTLAGITLVRSVDTGNQIAGNLAFREGAVNGTDAGIQAARSWLLANNTALLNTDVPAQGYYATWQETDVVKVDLTGNNTPADQTDDVDWDGTNGAALAHANILPLDAAGNEVAYVIHRMCNSQLGFYDTANECTTFTPNGPSSGNDKGTGLPMSGLDQPYYRVTVRSKGPRNTFSFVQVMVIM